MKSIITSLFLLSFLHTIGQSEMKTEQAFLFSPHFAVQLPGGDLKGRFTQFNSLGLGIDFKFKNNFIIGLDYDWYFGNSVRDTGIFSSITGPSGTIIDENGNFSRIDLDIRGNYGTINFGYLWAPDKSQSFTGMLGMVGVGVMQHRIDFISSQVDIPQINDEYEYGYDQLTYGLSIKQYLGYQYSTDRDRYRFRAGVEFNQGFTQGRRTWDFNANKPGTDKRLDLTTAFKLSILLPVYTKQAQDEEFFID